MEVEGKSTSTFSFRTWPSERSFHHPELNTEGRSNTTIGIGVCNHIGGAKESAVYRTLIEKHRKDLDLFIMNGDSIYELDRKKMKPQDITIDAARADYRAYLEGVPDICKSKSATPRPMRSSMPKTSPHWMRSEWH